MHCVNVSPHFLSVVIFVLQNKHCAGDVRKNCSYQRSWRRTASRTSTGGGGPPTSWCFPGPTESCCFLPLPAAAPPTRTTLHPRRDLHQLCSVPWETCPLLQLQGRNLVRGRMWPVSVFWAREGPRWAGGGMVREKCPGGAVMWSLHPYLSHKAVVGFIPE